MSSGQRRLWYLGWVLVALLLAMGVASDFVVLGA